MIVGFVIPLFLVEVERGLGTLYLAMSHIHIHNTYTYVNDIGNNEVDESVLTRS